MNKVRYWWYLLWRDADEWMPLILVLVMILSGTVFLLYGYLNVIGLGHWSFIPIVLVGALSLFIGWVAFANIWEWNDGKVTFKIRCAAVLFTLGFLLPTLMAQIEVLHGYRLLPIILCVPLYYLVVRTYYILALYFSKRRKQTLAT